LLRDPMGQHLAICGTFKDFCILTFTN